MFIFKNRFCISFDAVIRDRLAELLSLNEGHYRPLICTKRVCVCGETDREDTRFFLGLSQKVLTTNSLIN